MGQKACQQLASLLSFMFYVKAFEDTNCFFNIFYGTFRKLIDP